MIYPRRIPKGRPSRRRIIVTSKRAPKIIDTSKTQPTLDPDFVAKALGAEPYNDLPEVTVRSGTPKELEDQNDKLLCPDSSIRIARMEIEREIKALNDELKSLQQNCPHTITYVPNSFIPTRHHCAECGLDF